MFVPKVRRLFSLGCFGCCLFCPSVIGETAAEIPPRLFCFCHAPFLRESAQSDGMELSFLFFSPLIFMHKGTLLVCVFGCKWKWLSCFLMGREGLTSPVCLWKVFVFHFHVSVKCSPSLQCVCVCVCVCVYVRTCVCTCVDRWLHHLPPLLPSQTLCAQDSDLLIFRASLCTAARHSAGSPPAPRGPGFNVFVVFPNWAKLNQRKC